MHVTEAVVEPVAPEVSGMHLASEEHPLERGLALAMGRSRRSAEETLSRWFPTLGLGALAQTTDAATMQLAPVGDEVLAGPLPTPATLDRLAEVSFGPGAVRLVRDQDFLPDGAALVTRGGPGARSFLDVGRVAAALHEGYTAVFDGIDLRDGPSMVVAETVERVFGCPVNTNGYLSARPTTSFGAHWDDQEVVVLQLVGSKHWTIDQPPALSMDRRTHPADAAGPTAWEGTLAVGSCLYVPRGWSHRASSTEGLSYHHTITIPRLNGTGVLELLLDRARRAPARRLRQDADAADQVAGWIEAATDDRSVAWAVAVSRATIPSRSTQSLRALQQIAAGRADQVWVRSPVSSGWIVASSDDRSVVVSVNGHHLRLSSEGCRVLAEHGDGAARLLAPDHPDVPVALELCRHGMLQVSDRPPGWGIVRARD